MADPAQLNRIGRAYVQCLLVHLVVFVAAHNVRNQDEDGLGFRMIGGALPEEIFQDGNLGESGNAGQRLGLRVLEHAAEHVDFAFLQSDFVLDLSLPDHGLADAADVGCAGDGRNVHHNLQRHLAVGVDLGRDIDVYADVEILELRVHQRVDADAADAGLEGARRDRYAVADLERSFLAIHGANLRFLNELGAGVAEQRSCRSLRNGDGEVGRVEIVNLV